MNNARSTIHGSLYGFLSEAKQRTKPQQNLESRVISTANSLSQRRKSFSNESYQKISPIIPKNFNFVIKAATFSAVKENSQNDFSAKIQLFSVRLMIHFVCYILCLCMCSQHICLDYWEIQFEITE